MAVADLLPEVSGAELVLGNHAEVEDRGVLRAWEAWVLRTA